MTDVGAASRYVHPIPSFNPMIEALKMGAPGGLQVVNIDSGWMEEDTFPQGITHFYHKMKSTKNCPVFFTLDGHSLHTKKCDAVNFVPEEGGIMSIPYNTPIPASGPHILT